MWSSVDGVVDGRRRGARLGVRMEDGGERDWVWTVVDVVWMEDGGERDWV